MIVSCGEAMVDLVPDGDETYRAVLGGSPFNLALGVARLGGRAAYLWELSRDRLGERLLAELRRAGVDTRAVRRSERPTPVAVVDFSGPEPRYNIADPGRVMFDTDVPGAAITRFGRGACLAIGSAVLAHEPVAQGIETLAAAAPCLAIDYNVRLPSLAFAATYLGRLERLSAGAAVVKASEADLAMLGERDAAGRMRSFVTRGAALAILTRGADGAVAFTAGGETVEVPAAPVDLRDSVGAGDAFMAGLLASLQHAAVLNHDALAGLDRTRMVAHLGAAQAAAAACCGKRGAAMPSAAEVEAWAGKVPFTTVGP